MCPNVATYIMADCSAKLCVSLTRQLFRLVTLVKGAGVEQIDYYKSRVKAEAFFIPYENFAVFLIQRMTGVLFFTYGRSPIYGQEKI